MLQHLDVCREDVTHTGQILPLSQQVHSAVAMANTMEAQKDTPMSAPEVVYETVYDIVNDNPSSLIAIPKSYTRP